MTNCSGNLAWKLEENLLRINPSKMDKGLMRDAGLVIIDLQGKTVEGTLPPTGETPMDPTFFKMHPAILSVAHSHPPVTCALALAKGKNWLMRPPPRLPSSVGPVPPMPCAEAITEKLPREFEPFLPRSKSFIMENHGRVSMTRGGMPESLMNVQILEMTAQTLILALPAGRDSSNTMRPQDLSLKGAPGVNPSLEALHFG